MIFFWRLDTYHPDHLPLLLQSERKAIRQEDLQLRAHQVAASTLWHLLEYVRRGKLGVLWDAVMEAADRDLAGLEASGNPGRFCFLPCNCSCYPDTFTLPQLHLGELCFKCNTV